MTVHFAPWKLRAVTHALRSGRAIAVNQDPGVAMAWLPGPDAALFLELGDRAAELLLIESVGMGLRRYRSAFSRTVDTEKPC